MGKIEVIAVPAGGFAKRCSHSPNTGNWNWFRWRNGLQNGRFNGMQRDKLRASAVFAFVRPSNQEWNEPVRSDSAQTDSSGQPSRNLKPNYFVFNFFIIARECKCGATVLWHSASKCNIGAIRSKWIYHGKIGVQRSGTVDTGRCAKRNFSRRSRWAKRKSQIPRSR